MKTDLLEARRNKGLSQRKAADEIGVHRGVLDRAERGLGVQPRHMKAIADFYEVQPTDLWPVEKAA